MVYMIAVQECDEENKLSMSFLNVLNDSDNLSSLGRLFHKKAPL